MTDPNMISRFDHIVSMIDALEKRLDEQVDAHRREHVVHDLHHQREHQNNLDNIDMAYKRMDQRLEGMNEFRQSLKDQAATFATSENMEVLRERVNTLEKGIVVRYPAKEQVDAMDKRLDILEKYSANQQGRLWMLGTGLAAIVVILNILMRFL